MKLSEAPTLQLSSWLCQGRRICAFLVPPTILSLWSTVLLQALLSGRLEQVLHPLFRPWVGATAVGLMVLVVFYLVCLELPPLEQTPTFAQSLWSVLWLTGPILFASLCAPVTFSSSAWQARGFVSAPTASGPPPELLQKLSADPKAPVLVEVLDLLMAAQDPDLVKSLEGRSVRIVGQYEPATQATSNARVVRMWMLCCAADARPIGVEFDGPIAAAQAMDWIEVIGSLHFVPEKDGARPFIRAARGQKTAQPTQTFVY